MSFFQILLFVKIKRLSKPKWDRFFLLLLTQTFTFKPENKAFLKSYPEILPLFRLKSRPYLDTEYIVSPSVFINNICSFDSQHLLQKTTTTKY